MFVNVFNNATPSWPFQRPLQILWQWIVIHSQIKVVRSHIVWFHYYHPSRIWTSWLHLVNHVHFIQINDYDTFRMLAYWIFLELRHKIFRSSKAKIVITESGQHTWRSDLYLHWHDTFLNLRWFSWSVGAGGLWAGAALCTYCLHGGDGGNLQVLHDSFNVLLNTSPPITVVLWLCVRHSSTRGGFTSRNESSRGIFDMCKLSFNFNPSWASLQIYGLHKDLKFPS